MTPPGRTSQDTDDVVETDTTAFDDASEFDEASEFDDASQLEEGSDVGDQSESGEQFGSELQQDDELATDSLEEARELEAAADDEADEEATVAPPDAVFDDDGQDLATAVAGDDEATEVEGVRDGEFVCRSCFMAKRDTQLADSQRLLCRDCA